MELKFIKPSDLSGNLKASIHQSGRLSFSSHAAKKLDLANNVCARIAIDDSNPSSEDLFIILYNLPLTDGYKVSKAGDYYYINLKYLFEELGFDYENKDYSYEISKGDFDENGWMLKKK